MRNGLSDEATNGARTPRGPEAVAVESYFHWFRLSFDIIPSLCDFFFIGTFLLSDT